MPEAWYVIRHSLSGIRSPLLYCKTAWQAMYPGEILLAMTVFSLLLLFLFDFVNEKRDTIRVVSAWPAWLRWPLYTGFLWMLLLLIPKGVSAPFIYFQF